jgi:hypothetical protein
MVLTQNPHTHIKTASLQFCTITQVHQKNQKVNHATCLVYHLTCKHKNSEGPSMKLAIKIN